MNEASTEKIALLEEELSPLLEGAEDFEEKYERIQFARQKSVFFVGAPPEPVTDEEYFRAYCRENRTCILELERLYTEIADSKKPPYCPDDDKKALEYLISDNMTKEKKLSVLGNAYWQANHSGYSDAMANRLMAGVEDAQTERWSKNCKNRNAISRLYDWIKENEHD